MIFKPHIFDPVQRLIILQFAIESYAPEMRRWAFEIRYYQIHHPDWTVHSMEESRG